VVRILQEEFGKRGVTYQEALDEASNSDSHRGFSPVD
jgi:hypothetical protein